MKKLAIFTSGHSRGSNFRAICDQIQNQRLQIEISYLFITDNTAPIVNLAMERNIKIILYSPTSMRINDFLIKTCQDNYVDLIVLCGFMRKLSQSFFNNVKTPIINIHPALLPKYGGKGMYGMNVHNAVFANGDKKSGVTVHFVNENYDEGSIIRQKECDISNCKSADEVAKCVLEVEHEIYPEVVINLATKH